MRHKKMLKTGILEVEGTKYTLQVGQVYLIGRKLTGVLHDIEIDDQSVDHKHSIIDLTKSSAPQLFNIFSKHGTYVDDVKIPRFKSIPLGKTSKIRFGNVYACLQLCFEGDSGYLEERLNSPNGDTSEVICNSPERIVSSGSRLKNSLKNSQTSTPNQSTAPSSTSVSKSASNFLIPSCLARTSLGSNTSARSSDSFYVPETQYVPDAVNNSRTNNSTNTSFYSNISKKSSTAGDDDFFIPETQEVVTSASIPLSNHARVAFPSDDVNDTSSQQDRIPSSQFRMCTQDFNGSDDDDDLSNNSGDLLANVPLSMVIPVVKHDGVQIDDFAINDEEDIENEMSALQWSKKTAEDDNADGSVTPDGLFDVVGSVTSDLSQVKRLSADNKALSQTSTPDLFAIPEELETMETKTKDQESNRGPITSNANEKQKVDTAAKEDANQNEYEEYPPTQVFFKPISTNQSIIGTSLPPPPPEPEDDFDSLPATQVFAPPVVKSKPILPENFLDSLPETQVFAPPIVKSNSIVSKNLPKPQSNPISNGHVFAMPLASPKPRPSPKAQASLKPQATPNPATPQKSPSSTVPIDEDDLPPTQVFLKDDHVLQPIKANVFSSTLVDCDPTLSDKSFQIRINKLLDSDDDEMDEIVAPELVKQMREFKKKSSQTELVPEKPPTPANTSPKSTRQEKQKELDKNSEKTPEKNNFRIPPVKTPKTNYTKKPGVNIDDFMLTPDFLAKLLPKDPELLKQGEIKFREWNLERHKKGLFVDDHDPADSDDSDDDFLQLLPKMRETRSKSINEPAKEKSIVEQEEKVVCARVTRSKLRRNINKMPDDEEKEPKPKKTTRSRAAKRTAEVATTSKSSKINKLEGLDVSSNQKSDKPIPQKNSLRRSSQSKIEDKKVTSNNNGKKIKEDAKKSETPRKNPSISSQTNSDDESSGHKKKTAVKRESKEVSISKSSSESNDSDRTLRVKKKKLRIAITSCSQTTKDILSQYSGKIWEYTEDPKECDILILEACNRTYKLLVAIARGIPIVTIDWLKEVIVMRSTEVSFDKYISDNKKFQKRHNFTMRDSLRMAKNSSLFGGMNFMMTPNITPKPDEMKDIIICAGGTVLANIPTSQDDRNFYLVSENVDNELWSRYRGASQDVKVVTANSLMVSVMQQSLEPLMKSIHSYSL